MNESGLVKESERNLNESLSRRRSENRVYIFGARGSLIVVGVGEAVGNLRIKL